MTPRARAAAPARTAAPAQAPPRAAAPAPVVGVTPVPGPGRQMPGAVRRRTPADHVHRTAEETHP
ncbi:hypothetical protein ACFWBI_39005 [Streptomyces sp. NPDC059982]|uniref:hypothetical protein n=1 Tax=Streptomyces sp. NPDC059982 TaxID=3347024 RepID=UPI00367B0399